MVRWLLAQDSRLNLRAWATGVLLAVSQFSVDAAEQPQPVAVAVVEKRAIDQEIPLSGSVLARRRSELSSEVEALVAEVPVDEGDMVKRGDVLIRLDATLAKLRKAYSGCSPGGVDALHRLTPFPFPAPLSLSTVNRSLPRFQRGA